MANPQDPRKSSNPESVNARLLDRGIRHLLYLTRLQTREARKFVDQVKGEWLDPLVERVAGRLSTIKSQGLQEGTLTTAQIQGLNQLAGDIQREGRQTLAGLRPQFIDDLTAIAKDEAKFELGLFKQVIPIEWNFSEPTQDQLRTILTNQPFSGLNMDEWFSGLNDGNRTRVMQQVRQGMQAGESIDDIVRRLRGTRAGGFTDGVLNTTTNHAETLARSATLHTSNTARGEFFRQNEDLIKAEKYVATLDSRTCTQCMSLDGEEFELGRGEQPPVHPNCLLPDSLVLPRGRITGASKRWFDGDIIVFQTAGGHELSCTPNHPILTNRGFLPANALDVGSQVVHRGTSKGIIPINGQNINTPTRIEDIVESFLHSREVSSIPVPMTPIDFHGDGAGSKVAIIGTNRFLHNSLDPPLQQHFSDGNFKMRNIMGISRCILFSAFRPLAEFFKRAFSAARSFMRSLHLFLTLSFRHMLPLDRLGFALGPNVNAGPFKPSTDNIAGHVELLSNRIFRFSPLIPIDDLIDIKWNYVGMFGHIDPHLALKVLNNTNEPVKYARIIDIQKKKYSGYVYNIETTENYYYANGIASHNCRCLRTAITKSWRELGIDRDEVSPQVRASMDGEVPGDLTYNQWLKNQPDKVIDEALGKTKGQLFREGDLSASEFVDRRGREFTLDELRTREADAFTAAGLMQDD